MRNMAEPQMKESFVLLERLDEKSLRKCLQKYGLKLASPSTIEYPMTHHQNNCRTRSVSKKAKQRKQKKRNSDDFVLERIRKRKKRKMKPLCYTDDESCSEAPTKLKVESEVLSEWPDNGDSSYKVYKMPVQSESEGVNCDKISSTAEATTVSSASEFREEPGEDGRKRESQLKNEVRPQHEDVCCGRTDNREISSAVDSDIEIIKVCEKPCDETQTATSLSRTKKELIVHTESIQLSELEDDGYDSREDNEDERKTVIFEEEFQKDMDLEDLLEFEGKEISKKFNNREITNRKRQRLVKFKRKSMAGRNLAKIERRPKSKIMEGSGSGQETSEKSSECISEECLKEVCGLVKRLHELSRIIALLQRELPNNEEMNVHFNRVINAQQENFHREIRKGQKTIIKCYEKMLNFYSETSQVALEIGKRTSLSVEDVVNVISLCILIEGRCEAEKSGASPDGLKKMISDNFMKVIKKKISQMEGISSMEKQPRLQNKVSCSFAFPSSQSNHMKYQTVNQSTQQTKHQKDCNLLPLQPQQAGWLEIDNFASSHSQPRNVAKEKLSGGNFFPSSRTNSKQHNVTKSLGFPFSRSNSQEIINNRTGFSTSQRYTPQKHKEVSSADVQLTDVQLSQQTRSNPICFPSLANTQSSITFPPPQSNTHQSVVFTDFLPPKPIMKTSNQPPSQPSNKNSSSGPSKQKKKTNKLENISDLPKRKIVKNPTGSRSNNPSEDVNRHPALFNRPCDKLFEPHVREKWVHLPGRQVLSLEEPRNFKIPERQGLPQKFVLTSGLGRHGLKQTNPLPLDRTVPQRPVGNHTAATGTVVHRMAPTQNVRTSLASNHHVNHTVGAFPQRNTLPVSPANSLSSPATFFLQLLPENKPAENNKNPTSRPVGDLRSRDFISVTTSEGPVYSTKQAIRPSADECPLNTHNFLVSIRMSNKSKLLNTHVELRSRNCSATIELKNSQSRAEQDVLDPTVPQKLTMKNSRLQAGPFLNYETDGAEIGEKSIRPSTETKKTCSELRNSDREKLQSRAYVCAKDDCSNPGVRICKGCQSIIYCSATCQFKHWVQKHKAECYQLRALRD